MLQAILEALTTFGPIVFLMLTPILIPLAVETIGAITDRRKMPTRSRTRELTQAQLNKAA